MFCNMHLGLTTGNRSDHVNTGYRSVHSFEQRVLSTVTKKLSYFNNQMLLLETCVKFSDCVGQSNFDIM